MHLSILPSLFRTFSHLDCERLNPNNAVGSLSFFTDSMSLFVTWAHLSTSRSWRHETSRCDGVADWCYQSSHMSASSELPLMDRRAALYMRSLLSCGFSTSGRLSTRWSIRINFPSFWKTTVCPAIFVLANITINSDLVAFIKLNHAIGGIYMFVHLHTQESAH